jgi:hypothetical protein
MNIITTAPGQNWSVMGALTRMTRERLLELGAGFRANQPRAGAAC